jgi:hypothetical protein
MSEKEEGHALPIQIFRSDSSWEHQERSVYTVQALTTEFANLLSPQGSKTAADSANSGK